MPGATAKFRFAPSPNGLLHLGHAYSALLNQQMCSAVGGTLLLRLEDIDQARCTAELERQMLEDLSWLGIKWSETPRRQSRHFSAYSQALDQLRREGLVYPAFLSRGEIRSMVAEKTRNGIEWPCDPDGAPHYPGFERDWPQARQTAMREQQPLHAWRLNMREVGKRVGEPLNWQETGKNGDGKPSPVRAHPELWGDVVLARSDTPTSYHLAVTLDDAEQEITHVVRGRDLYHSTAIHRLLQHLLNLPAPVYHHHDLVLDEDGRKLSKSKGDVSLKSLREKGVNPKDIPQLFRFSTPGGTDGFIC